MLAEILNGGPCGIDAEREPIDLGEEFDLTIDDPEMPAPQNFSRPEMEEMEAAGDLVTIWAYTLRRLGGTSAKLCEGVVGKCGSLRKMLGISQILVGFGDTDESREVRIFLRAVSGWGFRPDAGPGARMVDEHGNYVEVSQELLEAGSVAKGRVIVCFHGDYAHADAWQPSDRVLCCVGRPDEKLVQAFLTGDRLPLIRPSSEAAPSVLSTQPGDEIDPKPRYEPVEPETLYAEHPRWRSKMVRAVERLARSAVPDIDRIQHVLQSLASEGEDSDYLHARVLNITARLLEISDEMAGMGRRGEAEAAAPAAARACLDRCLAEIERAIGLDEALREPLHGDDGSALDDMRRLSQNMARSRFEHAMTLMDDLVAGLREEIGRHSGYAGQEAMLLLVAAEQALTLRESLTNYNATDPRLDVEIRSKAAARAFREAGLKPLLSVAAGMGRAEMMEMPGIGEVTMARVLAEVEATGAPSVLQASFVEDIHSIDDRIRSGIANGALQLDGKIGPKLRADAALAASAALRKSAYGAGGLRATMIDELARDRLQLLLSAIETWRRNEPKGVRSPEYLSKFSRSADATY